MLLIIGLVVGALAAMLVSVAAVTRPYIAIPAAGVAAGVLLVLGFEFAIAGHGLVSVAAAAPGAVAFGFGLFLTLADEKRCAGDPPLEPADLYPGHDVAADNVAGQTADAALDELAGTAR